MRVSQIIFFILVSIFFVGGNIRAEQEGALTREIWTEIDGTGLWQLRNNPKFHQAPNYREDVTSFEQLSNWGERYGQRLRGYLVPESSGEFTFWIAGDANCEFWLSSDECQFNKQRLAYIHGMGWGHKRDYVKPGLWGKYPSQKSEKITLEAGKKYFIEILHKDKGGPDHVSLAWSKKENDPEVVPFSLFQSFVAEPLDKDGDNLPDAWEQSHGLDSNEGGLRDIASGALGDPDGDGWLNWEECESGSDPREAQGVKGALSRELWRGVFGKDLTALFEQNKFYERADERDLVFSAGSDAKGSDGVGIRLRGYITPEVSGDYEFWIAGDDNCEFSLSSDANKFNRERLAWVEKIAKQGATETKKAVVADSGKTKWREWDKYETQRSRVVRLEAGQPYFLELLLKDHFYKGHVELAWQAPGQKREPVPARVLTSYVPTSLDQDDDELPSEWEEAFGFDPEKRNSLADPDGDLIPAIMEYELGLNPIEPDSLQGAVHRELWRGISGQTISTLWDADIFYDEPTVEALFSQNFYFGNAGDSYGQRIRALLTAPETGQYEFWIAGNENCELWLSSDEQPWNKKRIAWIEGPGTGGAGDWVNRWQWGKYPSQRSVILNLEEGKSYYLEVLHKEGFDDDHIGVAWKIPGQERKSIQPEYLASLLPNLNDVDADSLPDDWEQESKLNSADNGANDRAREGQKGDYDGDGLENLQEYQLGTSPHLADTDGDGVTDSDELRFYGSDPRRRDVAPPGVIQVFAAESPVSSTVELSVDEDGSVTTQGRRGEMEYEFALEKAGHYLVKLVGQGVGGSGSYKLPIRISVNGREAGLDFLSGPLGESSELAIRLPYLRAGIHLLQLDSENFNKNWQLQIQSLELLEYRGDDEDGDGTPDWLQKRLGQLNGITTSESFVSPACIEGSALWPDDVQLQAKKNQFEVLSGIDGQWFANVELEPVDSTSVLATFDQGTIEASAAIVWKNTNLATCEEELVVRVGDALKLTAFEGDFPTKHQVTILLNGKRIAKQSADEPFIHRFEKEGTHTLTCPTVSKKKVEVKVITADFGEELQIMAGNFQKWELLGIPESASLEADQILGARNWANEDGLRIMQVSLPLHGTSKARVIARAGKDGPIVAVGDVASFQFAHASLSGDHEVIEILEDGTLRLRVGYVLDGKIPSDLRIVLRMWVHDAVFADGSTEWILTAEDFDENGIAFVEMFKAPGDSQIALCHTFELFQGEIPINP